jgi:hypothetical protein
VPTNDRSYSIDPIYRVAINLCIAGHCGWLSGDSMMQSTSLSIVQSYPYLPSGGGVCPPPLPLALDPKITSPLSDFIYFYTEIFRRTTMTTILSRLLLLFFNKPTKLPKPQKVDRDIAHYQSQDCLCIVNVKPGLNRYIVCRFNHYPFSPDCSCWSYPGVMGCAVLAWLPLPKVPK